MGFFSALVKMLFKSEKSKTSEQKPKTVSSPKTNLFPYTEEDAAKFTADLRKLFKNPISERWGKQICLN